MPSGIKVAAIQLNSQEDVGQNLSRVQSLVARAADDGARVAVLPENFAWMGGDEKGAIAEDLEAADGPIIELLSQLARKHKITIIGGGMPERSSDPARPFNTCVAVGPDGKILAKYRKIHLFDVDLADGTKLEESASTTRGAEAKTVAIGGFEFGLSVCYDVRFPELYRKLVNAGAQAVVVPAAFTLATGKDHWHVLLRARAIENQLYVIAAAQHGRHPKGRQTYGKSLIIDPWGEVIAQVSEGEGYCVAVLDPAYQAKVRKSLPCLSHRVL